MIPFCIDATILGTKKHLVCDDGYQWTQDVPDNVWYFSGKIKSLHPMCLDTLLCLTNTTVNILPPSKFVDSIKSLTSGSNIVVPWQMTMPETAHRNFVKNLINDLNVVLNTISTDYYTNTWVHGNNLLKRLLPAKINTQVYDNLVNSNVSNMRVLETFKPRRDGFAQNIVYNRLGTKTGRLIHESGPDILTLNRDYRSILKSSYDDGSIVSVDFSSLEPRVLLYEAGGQCNDLDLYKMLSFGNERISRSAIKQAVISELYGSSKKALEETLDIHGKELNAFLKKIRGVFRIAELRKRLKAQFATHGYIENRYGRRIFIDEPLDHIFINSYAQSTGVDVTMLGFERLLSQLTSTSGIRPLFVLHDALILDVRSDRINDVTSSQHVKVPGYVQSFVLKAEVFKP